RRMVATREGPNASISATPDVFALNRQIDGPPRLPNITSMQEIRLRLRGQTMVSYVQVSNRLGAWILDERGVDFRWLASDASDVFRLAQNFVELCSNPSANAPALAHEARTLYE